MVVLVPPASPTPLLLAQLAGELGPFPGILNVISGPASLGPVLAAQPGVQKVAFCGAIEVSWSRGAETQLGRGQHAPPPAEHCDSPRKDAPYGGPWQAGVPSWAWHWGLSRCCS